MLENEAGGHWGRVSRLPRDGKEPVVIHAANLRTPNPHRSMYQRYLSGWAMDMLELRRRGLDRPVCRDVEEAGPACPGRTGERGSGGGVHRPFARPGL